MPITQEVFVEAHPGRSASFFGALQSIIQWGANLPIFCHLIPLAQKVQSVAEPVGRLTVRRFPHFTHRAKNKSLTIISANLWHDWPKFRNSTERLESFAGMVEAQNADVVLLQEVTRTPDFWADHWLSDRLGMAFAYCRANGHETGIGFEEGLAVLSRYPIQNLYLQQLGSSANMFVHRLAMGAKILSPWGAFAAISVHLALVKSQNVSQLAHLHAWLNSIMGGLPTVIGGDFNAHENSPQMTRLGSSWLDTFRHLHPHADGTTHELRTPWGDMIRRSRLDYIFLRPGNAEWNVLETRHLDGSNGPHSDHRAVLTRLVLTR